MATFAKAVPLLVLLLSLQTLARETRFFSKVTRVDDSKPIDNVQRVQLEAKDDDQLSFLPQTPNTAYGLYGRLAQTDSATTTTTTKKYQEPTYDNNKNPNYFNNRYNFESTTKDAEVTPAATEPKFYDNYGQSKNYAPELRGAYTKTGSGNAGGYKKSGGGSYWNGEQQGMSDTRFLENGRYFYDIENEKLTNDVQSYNSGAYQGMSEQRKYFSDFQNQKPNNRVWSYNNGRRPEYYNNEGYYSGSTRSYNKITGNGFRGGEQSLEEEEFDFDP